MLCFLYVYLVQTNENGIVDKFVVYPQIHFLTRSKVEDVTKAVAYGYKTIVEEVKKLHKSSRSDIVGHIVRSKSDGY